MPEPFNVPRRTLLVLILLAVGSSSPAAAVISGDERIIVSGASGNLGRLAVDELLSRGVPAKQLILVSRRPAELAEYASKGATTRFGDVDRPESLSAAYAGGTRMLLISLALGPDADTRPQRHRTAFDAAVKAGVRHIVYTSFVGADKGGDPVSEAHRKTEEFLRASGAKWTVLRNGLYADMRLPQALQIARTGRAVAWPGDPKSALVTRQDCAAAAAGALLGGGRFENQTFDVTGPELVNTADIAAIVGTITGSKIELVERAPAGPPGPDGPFGPPPGSSIMAAAAVVTDAVAKLAGRKPTIMRDMLLANELRIRAAAAAAPAAGSKTAAAAPATTLRRLEPGMEWSYRVTGRMTPPTAAEPIPISGTIRIRIESAKLAGREVRVLRFEQMLKPVAGPTAASGAASTGGKTSGLPSASGGTAAGVAPPVSVFGDAPPFAVFYFTQNLASGDVRIVGDNHGPHGADRIARGEGGLFIPGRWSLQKRYDERIEWSDGAWTRNFLHVDGVEVVETGIGPLASWRSPNGSDSSGKVVISGTDWWPPDLGQPSAFEARTQLPDGGLVEIRAVLESTNVATRKP